MKDENCEVREEDSEKFHLNKFDENDLSQHLMKVLLIFGCLFGLRGNQEHTMLTLDNIGNGIYPDSHHAFAGKKWWGLQNICDKTLKINLGNFYARDEKELGRFPVMPDLDEDMGGTIMRWVEKLKAAPGSSKKKKPTTNRLYRRIAPDGKSFENRPMGHETVRKTFREAFKFLGISNWETLRPHALRGLLISVLANDPSVSLKETMKAARHKTADASATYQKCTSKSESAKVSALMKGVKKPAEVKPAAEPIIEAPADPASSSSNAPANFRISPSTECPNTDSSYESLELNCDTREPPAPAYTQIQMDFLRDEMNEVQNGRMQSVRTPPTYTRGHQRRGVSQFPTNQSSFGNDPRMTMSRSANQSAFGNDPRTSMNRSGANHSVNRRSSYEPARNAYPRQQQYPRPRHYGGRAQSHSRRSSYEPYHVPTRRPSRNELEVMELRQRVADMRREQLMHDEEETNELYYDSLDHYGYDRHNMRHSY